MFIRVIIRGSSLFMFIKYTSRYSFLFYEHILHWWWYSYKDLFICFVVNNTWNWILKACYFSVVIKSRVEKQRTQETGVLFRKPVKIMTCTILSQGWTVYNICWKYLWKHWMKDHRVVWWRYKRMPTVGACELRVERGKGVVEWLHYQETCTIER